MDMDTNKIDEAVLALLYLTRCDNEFRAAAWKGHDWDALNRLHEKGYIDNPVSKAKSVGLLGSWRERPTLVRLSLSTSLPWRTFWSGRGS
jgi:hypothetical protein